MSNYFHTLFLEVVKSKGIEGEIFHIINSAPIVTLRYNVKITSSKCLDLNYFHSFCLEVNIIPRN